jgi:hypothetical protein
VRAFQCQLFSPGVFLSILVSSASYSLPQNVAEIAGKSTLGKDTLTSFGVGIFDIESQLLVKDASIEDLITVKGYVSPSANDLGKEADIYVLAAAGQVYFIRNSNGIFIPFNLSTDVLIPAFENQPLTADLGLDFFTAKVDSLGTFQFFIGYRITGSEEIVYSSVGGDVKITLPGRWRTEPLQWIPYNFNETEKLCDDPVGICAGWINDATQECKDNYKFGATPQSTETRLKYEHCLDQIVFKPYISEIPSKVIESPSQEMVEEANRLKSVGWDKPSAKEPVFVVATDVPDGLIEELKEGLAEAEKYIGRWGPTRIYVVGNLLEPAQPVIKDFCESNYKGNTYRIDYCLTLDQGKDMREMATIYPGANGFQQSSWDLVEPLNSYVLNPASDEENRFVWSSGIDPDMEVSVLAHEYFHVYQGSHLIYRGGSSTPVGWGMPRWFEESVAVYFQIVLGEKQGWQFRSNMDQQIEEAIRTVDQFRRQFPGVTVEDLETGKNTRRLQSYCVSCYGRVQYDYGLLGIRMLALKTSDEAVFFDYYKSSKEVGWMKAFENVFGLTVTQFYHELEILLRKSEKEQIRALKRD